MGFVLLSAVVLLPVIELIVLIKVGGAIGILPLLALLIGTGIAGVVLLRWQGLNVARRTFEQLARREVPVDSMVDGIGLSLAGFLLLLPGLVSDVAAMLLLVPPIRRMVVGSMMGLFSWRWKSKSGGRPTGVRAGPRDAPRAGRDERRGDGVVIEGEFERIDERTIRPGTTGRRGDDEDPPRGTPGASPWQR